VDTPQEALSRSRIFVLLDGSFVVRWNEKEVQDLLTGKHRNYERRDYGAAITDFELEQLKQVGIVDQYDREQVWLSPLPLRREYYHQNAQKRRVRSYYINTTHPQADLEMIDSQLLRLGVEEELQARIRDEFVVIWSKKGQGFSSFDASEEMRLFLVTHAPNVFANCVIGFIETSQS
jgi:hypothetical protein